MSARPLRILFATPRFFPAQGGVENHVYQVARRLAQRGHEPSVFTTDDDGALPPHDSVEGVRILRFRAYPARSDLLLSPQLHRAIQAERARFDLLHLQNYLTLVSPAAMHAAKRTQLPYVVTFHGGGHSQSWRNAIRGLQGRMLRQLLLHADRLIATARFEVDYYGQRLDLPRKNFAYVSNGCDIAVRTVDVPLADPPLIVSIGRLEKYKGHHRVLQAFATLLTQEPRARLRLLGDGPYKPELEEMARGLGVADKVEIGGLPLAERQRMAETLSSASLVTLLSEFETQPMAALEAIALGRPVLVADTSGLSELAQQGYAHAVPLDASPATLAGAMIALMRAPKSRQAIRLPTWDDCTDGLIELYRDVLERHKTRGSV